MSELEKWAKVAEEARVLHEFLDFLNSQDIVLSFSKHGVFKQRDQLVYDFFEIDVKQLDKERVELLESARQSYQKTKEESQEATT